MFKASRNKFKFAHCKYHTAGLYADEKSIYYYVSYSLVSVGFGHLGHFSNHICPPDTVPFTNTDISLIEAKVSEKM